MTKNNETKNDNTLYSWATGKLASVAIGLAVGVFIYKSGIIQNVFGKLFKGNPSNKTNFDSFTSSGKEKETDPQE